MQIKMNISEFEKFQKVMRNHLSDICEQVVNGGDYSLLTIAKKLDGIVYQYTGNEQLVCDTDENNKKKILFVEDLINTFHKDESEISVKVKNVRKNKKTDNEFFTHLIPSLSGKIHRKDILMMMFSSVLISHIWKENPKAFKWSLGDIEEDNDSDV